jgi:hypothetical protein
MGTSSQRARLGAQGAAWQAVAGVCGLVVVPLRRDVYGPARLTMITCGGPSDREARRYRDNIVVTAAPV